MTKFVKCSPLEWDHNTTPLLKINFQAIKRKAVWVNFSEWLQPLLEKQREICWINGEGAWGREVRCISEIRLGFPCMIRVIIAPPMNEVNNIMTMY